MKLRKLINILFNNINLILSQSSKFLDDVCSKLNKCYFLLKILKNSSNVSNLILSTIVMHIKPPLMTWQFGHRI